MTTTSRVNKSALIREYLLAHYPCQAIPHGDMTVIANLFVVSRELVRKVANNIGVTGRISITPQKRDPTLCGFAQQPRAFWAGSRLFGQGAP